MSQTTTSLPAAYPQYFGAQPQTGSHRFLTVEGQKLKLNGSAYELVPGADGNGKPKLKRRKISTTPGYAPNPSIDVSFVTLCPKTNKRVRLIGQIVPVACKPVAYNSVIPPEPERTALITAATPVSQSICTPQVEGIAPPSEVCNVATPPAFVEESAAKKIARNQRQLAMFKREMEIVVAQCLAGIDPPVSITATGFMSNRSHATMYRDIQKNVLPQPTKIGRSSMFPYSVVKAYAAGQLVGGAE